ncbi:uncharacterized protein AMSG_02956 [Thecamonas trahens ATCC 50062]|uniref:ADP-ribosylhydrolase ARH3 n=1 Tax=Thecamonas trahens ATCC 50062 TaxID=461836 RepID=A0A0L0D2W6_THETB|nr:hypothetical protein AMSG_02956 [Thecamonas trahens ATCC 50062]KNC46520.1 hypothetical protein AMSG_02956 [Thecamonas trahens ATCC 50062]|eukprot:XP_013760301.1 hypothetical protein AMSG_02956 [Thecamonas trahens ATCC 50062]
MEASFHGALLGTLAGDVLGAPFEGESMAMVQQVMPDGPWSVADSRSFPNAVLAAVELGVDLGPSAVGEYTDDTEATFSLAESIAACRGVHRRHAALSMAHWWARGARGGYSGYTFAKMAALARGASVDETGAGTSAMPGGSYANGGAMRIAPVGLAYAACAQSVSIPRIGESSGDPDALARVVESLRQPVAAAIACTHTHPEAIDGAALLAAAVAQAVHVSADDVATLDGPTWFGALAAASTTEPLKTNMHTVAEALASVAPDAPHPESVFVPTDKELLQSWTDKWFQIRTSDAIPTVLYLIARYGVGPHAAPAETLVRAWIPDEWRATWESDPRYGAPAAAPLAAALASLACADDQPALVVPDNDPHATNISDALATELAATELPTRFA